MDRLEPRSPEELADALAAAGSSTRTLRLGGAFSKDLMGGPLLPTAAVISTARMNRILQYEPRDLTISVEAGVKWADLTNTLAVNKQMIPLDPPFFGEATVGGVVAANTSGPRRRMFGTARDVVIGMKFATLQGKLIQSGGMVVKNVAGLDMAKLLIGSFGTLAGIAVVNFKVTPMPAGTRTFVLPFPSLDDAVAARNRIIRSVLQPWALDLVNPMAARRIGLEGFCLLIETGGNAALLERYSREFATSEQLDGAAAENLWTRVREFTPTFLAEHPAGAVVRISATIEGLSTVVRAIPRPVVARAANGVVYGYFADATSASLNGQRGAIEFAPDDQKPKLDQWPAPGSDFAMMEKIKQMFDSKRLLNPGRLYGRI